MTERAPRRDSRSTRDGSSRIPAWTREIGPFLRGRDPRAALRAGALIAALVGGALMVFTEFSTLFEVKVLTASCDVLAEPGLKDTCNTTGAEQHSYALLLIGALTMVLAYGATLGGSRPAAVGLLVLGALVIGIALLGDVPDSGKTGAIGRDFEQATSVKGPGLTYEIAGGVLALMAGLASLVLGSRREQ